MKWNKLSALTMIAVVVSFLGFCVENLWLMVTKGYMDNRNMILPFLFGYGLAIVAVYVIFGTPDNMRLFGWKMPLKKRWQRLSLYLVLMALCVSIAEVLLGSFVEVTCDIIWWDYSELPLNITRYTTVPTSLAFGAAILLFMDKFFMPLYRGFLAWNPVVLRVVSTVLLVLLAGDFLWAACLMYIRRSVARRWKIKLSGLLITGILKRCHAA